MPSRADSTEKTPSKLKSFSGETSAKEDVATTEMPKYEDVLADFKITIYPNPTKGLLRVDITGVEIPKDARIYIYNVQGAIVRQLTGISVSNELDISAQPAGSYIIKILLNKDNISTWTIIKN